MCSSKADPETRTREQWFIWEKILGSTSLVGTGAVASGDILRGCALQLQVVPPRGGRAKVRSRLFTH